MILCERIIFHIIFFSFRSEYILFLCLFSDISQYGFPKLVGNYINRFMKLIKLKTIVVFFKEIHRCIFIVSSLNNTSTSYQPTKLITFVYCTVLKSFVCNHGTCTLIIRKFNSKSVILKKL